MNAPQMQPAAPYGQPAPQLQYQPQSQYAPQSSTLQQQQQQQPPNQPQIQSSSSSSGGANKSFDTKHDDLIHDAQFDYYGRRLATASSDRTIKIWSAEPNQEPALLATLSGHEGPVWQVAWAHPQFGSLLASCSFDGSVVIWKEQPQSSSSSSYYSASSSAAHKMSWQKIKEHRIHDGSSVNAISWAPFESGLKLACASSDGRVSVLACNVESGGGSNNWVSTEFHAHAAGCNAVSWAPVSLSNILSGTASNQPLQQSPSLAVSPERQPSDLLATGGCDNLIRLWKWSESEQTYSPEGPALEGHLDWVRDVAFNPSDRGLLASCSQDRTVRIWKHDAGSKSWTSQLLSKDQFADSLWRLSWSTAGAQLAVAGGDNKITLWREDGAGSWEITGTVDH